MDGKAKLPKSHRSASKKHAQQAVELENRLQQATDENYLLPMQLSKLQSTLKHTQSKLDSVQTWRDVSAGSPKSPCVSLFEEQVESLTAQLAATEEKLKRSQQNQLKLRTVQTWQASTTEPASGTAQPERGEAAHDALREAAVMQRRHKAELERVRTAAAEREREAEALMREQSAEIDGLREQLDSTQQALTQLEASCSELTAERNELELLYSRGDGEAQRRISELEATVAELQHDRSSAGRQIARLEKESVDWQEQRATMEKSLLEADEAWKALGQQEVKLKEYAAVKRERDDIHAKLAVALSASKDAEARAAKSDKQLELLKKKRGKLVNGAAKQWEKERSEMESAIMAERAKIDGLNARIDVYETNKQVLEKAQVKLKAKLDACVSADAAQQELAEAHTATLEQNRKLVADLAAVQGFEGELHNCRAELASMRASLKKETSKKESLQMVVAELEEARNASRKGEGEKGVLLAQLREQVHSWKSKAEKRKEKLIGLAKELAVAQQALDKTKAQETNASETAEAHEEDSRMWRLVRWTSSTPFTCQINTFYICIQDPTHHTLSQYLMAMRACIAEQVAEQAQEEESHLSTELERTTRRLEHSELQLEEAEQQLMAQKNSAREASADRDKMRRELTSVLEAVARGNTEEVRRRLSAGESFAPAQPDWLGPRSGGHSTAGSSGFNSASFAWMDDPLGTGADAGTGTGADAGSGRARRSHSPSLLSDDGESAGSVTSTSTAGSRQTHDSLNIEQALERSRQRAAELRQQQIDGNSGDTAQNTAKKESVIDRDEVAFMAMAAAREVHEKQESWRNSKVDARQVRTPVTSAVRSEEAASASAARRRNKRAKQKEKMARLSAAEASF